MDRPPISVEELYYSETDFIVHFFDVAHIATVVTASSAQASLWVNQFLYAYQDDNNTTNTDDPTRFLVGLDVEWKSEIGHEDNPVAVLQLCVDQRCLMFQILCCDAIPNALLNFLSDTRFTFTGSKIHEKVQRLISDYNVRVGNIMEIRTLLEERAYLRRAELRLARDILIWKMQNQWSVQLGNWDEERLSLEQIMYACLVAFLPFETARRLLG
ncbi:hypothetical protein QJS04_geneDACA022295 [Acorus gramineus]|uniref:3'-5' exonuclease domain-containing protein n=1 Tax=Acorus gramineus TaxID=55184 RepID=A0AAV9BAK3_ACOGR|nr:hypothetical protein QJS04_geneDACA022295 [Acorus gramineus]